VNITSKFNNKGIKDIKKISYINRIKKEKKVMKKKNLFQAVKTFINDTPKGETFTTKELIASVGNQEEPSSWKKWNNNPYYRTHTYKSYLKRTGFLSNPKYGVWEVKNHIPDFVNLGTIEFLVGYKNYKNAYNGLTKQQIKNSIEEFNVVMEKGYLTEMYPDIKNLNKEYRCVCEEGNRCIVCFTPDGETTQQFLGSIGMEGQMLRQLIMSQPINEVKYLIEEREDLEKVRILNEIKKEKVKFDQELLEYKVMKFDLEKGKQGLVEYFERELERASMYSLEYIKECDDMDDVKSEVRSFNAFEEVNFNLIRKIERASTLSLVFEALDDTALEDDDETILSFFIEGL
jgi:hypothetical protein